MCDTAHPDVERAVFRARFSCLHASTMDFVQHGPVAIASSNSEKLRAHEDVGDDGTSCPIRMT